MRTKLGLVGLACMAGAVAFPQVAHADTVTLYPSGGSVWVRTVSGKTTCQVTSDAVACGADFVVPTPLSYGRPANVVRVTPNGSLSWNLGDTGPISPTTLVYGTPYSAIGWIINPTTTGTTFTNAATGHGMTVGLQGATAF
jgi:hypothetical protein